MTTCVISQPRFFPGLHYLHRMLQADVFVIFDTVQFTPRHEENRAKLKTSQGTQWLTVPVRKQGRDMRIVDTLLSKDQPWQQDAVKTLAHLYGKTPHYEAHAAEVASILHNVPDKLRHRTGYGLDTCHLFASGYDLRVSPEAFKGILDELMG